MSRPALAFDRVCKSFGRHAALTDFTLDVGEGELFGLVGVNGAGKTTLLKCLLDFAAADSGTIEIFGASHRNTAARAPLAFLPERFLPPYYLTGEDFLRYMLRLHAAPFSLAAAHETFAALDLDLRALQLPVRSFSKGMTQKLGLAACLLSGKQLYVLDEPTSGLDPKARALLKRRLLALRTAGRTLFLTSHLLADVEQLCDRMAILHAGTIRFIGTPAELLARYGAAHIEAAFLACIEDEARVPVAAVASG
jgi:ABC-2 type transport system ATP-binding protein